MARIVDVIEDGLFQSTTKDRTEALESRKAEISVDDKEWRDKYLDEAEAAFDMCDKFQAVDVRYLPNYDRFTFYSRHSWRRQGIPGLLRVVRHLPPELAAPAVCGRCPTTLNSSRRSGAVNDIRR